MQSNIKMFVHYFGEVSISKILSEDDDYYTCEDLYFVLAANNMVETPNGPQQSIQLHMHPWDILSQNPKFLLRKVIPEMSKISKVAKVNLFQVIDDVPDIVLNIYDGWKQQIEDVLKVVPATIVPEENEKKIVKVFPDAE